MTAPPPPSGASMQPPRVSKLGWKLGLSIVILGVFVWLLERADLPWLPKREAFHHVNWSLLGASALAWVVSYLLRAGRWYWLLLSVARVPLATVLRVAFVGFAALIALPIRAGEVVRPLLMRREGKVSGWAATGTLGAERVIDGLVISGLLVLGLASARRLDPLPERIGDLHVPVRIVPSAAQGAVLVFSAASVAMLLYYWRRRLARRFTEWAIGLISPRIGKLVADKLEETTSGLDFLRHPRQSLPYLSATLAYWLTLALSIQLAGRAAGLEHYSFPQAVVTLGVISLGVLLPNAPGFLGALQLSIYAALAMYFPEPEVVGPGAMLVFLTFAQHILVPVLLGAVLLLLGKRGEHPATAADKLPERAELG